MKITRREFLQKTLSGGAAAAITMSFPGLLSGQTRENSIVNTISGFKGPYGLSFGPGKTLWVTDAAGYCVHVLDNNGDRLEKFGRPGGSGDRFNYPQGICVDGEHIYIMDSNNGRITIFDTNFKLISTIGNIGGYPEAFYTPKGVFVSDRIYACNTRNHFVSVFDKTSHKLVAKFGDLGDDPPDLKKGSINYHFRLPTDVVVDNQGKIYVVDSKHGIIKVLDADGKFLYQFGGIGTEPGQLNFPEGIALDKENNIYVCDTLNARIQKFDNEGNLLGVFAKGIKKPTSVKVGDNGLLYIVDSVLRQLIIAKWEA